MCKWLPGAVLQAALQGAGSVHLRASLLLLLQLLSWEVAPVDRRNGDQWRRTNRGVGGGIKDGGRNSDREWEYLSLLELQYWNRRGILIIMRKKNPKRERTRWVEGFGGFKTSRRGWLMKEDAEREGSEGEGRLFDSLHKCSVSWRHTNKAGRVKSVYTLTYGEKVPVSLSAVSTPTANEMTSITQRTTKPVGYCLHLWCTVSHKRSASWTGGGAFWTVALPCFLSVIIITACCRSAGKQTERAQSVNWHTAVKNIRVMLKHHNDSHRAYSPCLINVELFNFVVVSPPLPPPKWIYLVFEQKFSAPACIRRCPDSCRGSCAVYYWDIVSSDKSTFKLDIKVSH